MEINMNEQIDNLGFSVRTRNSLHRGGIHKLSDICCLTYDGLRSLPGCGVNTIREVRSFLEAHDLSLTPEEFREVNFSITIDELSRIKDGTQNFLLISDPAYKYRDKDIAVLTAESKRGAPQTITRLIRTVYTDYEGLTSGYKILGF